MSSNILSPKEMRSYLFRILAFLDRVDIVKDECFNELYDATQDRLAALDEPDEEERRESRREAAMEAGMGLGVDAYNEMMGFDLSPPPEGTPDLYDDEICSGGGEHMPDWNTLHHERGTGAAVDVTCKICWRSGSIPFDGNDINW